MYLQIMNDELNYVRTMNDELKHNGLIYVELGIAPSVPAKSGLVVRAVTNELLLRPIHLIGYLRQKRSAAKALADIYAMTV